MVRQIITRGNVLKIESGKNTNVWVDLPDPNAGSCNFTIATNVSDGRSAASGKFIGAVIGPDKYKIEPEWTILPAEDFKAMLTYYNRPAGGRFINRYKVYDPRYNEFKIFTMYVSDRTGTPDRVVNGVAQAIQNARIALIEV